MKTLVVAATLVAFFAAMAFYVPAKLNVPAQAPDMPALEAPNFDPVPFSSTVPSDVANGYDATQQALAIFAWQEFVALNWPAKKNPNPAKGMSGFFRGQASSDNFGSNGSGGIGVWETFQHRVELYPSNQNRNKTYTLPDINAIPNYQYPSYTTIVKPAGVDTTLFANLDEASEISLADMYFSPLADKVDALRKKYGMNPTPAQMQEIETAGIKAGIVYEAKANPVIFNYVKRNSFNNVKVRKLAAENTIQKINNMPKKNPNSPYFELPSGSIEMKATWRRYNASADNLKDFHWTKGIYYTGQTGNMGSMTLTAKNDTFLLVALHIIQKTPNIPSFTFATFEHVSNEKNGFRYVNTNPETDSMYARPLPDAGIRKVIRQYPIPGPGSAFDLGGFNAAVQNQLRAQFGNDVVWANYQLIGVQAKVQNDPGGRVAPQEFFLSNFATESNNALQFFQGGLAGPFTNVPDPDLKHVYVQDPQTKKYTAFSSGGCSGCHGSQGQDFGTDFSVISANGNSFSPEPVEPYPMGAVLDQNPALFPLPHKAMGAVPVKRKK